VKISKDRQKKCSRTLSFSLSVPAASGLLLGTEGNAPVKNRLENPVKNRLENKMDVVLENKVCAVAAFTKLHCTGDNARLATVFLSPYSPGQFEVGLRKGRYGSRKT
jgi:hypothetical protein